MSEPKTRPTTESVAAFLARVADDERRADCKSLVRLMKAATGKPAKMWGASIVGFGCLYLKRLERGRFHLGNHTDGEALTPVMLQLILEGLELSEAKRHRRFSLPDHGV